MVFGSKRETKPDSLSREDVVGNLYPDSLTSEVDVAQPASEFPRGGDRGNESVIDPARFNGKYVSDRDLRIEGEAQGEIECQGTLIISPQARAERHQGHITSSSVATTRVTSTAVAASRSDPPAASRATSRPRCWSSRKAPTGRWRDDDAEPGARPTLRTRRIHLGRKRLAAGAARWRKRPGRQHLQQGRARASGRRAEQREGQPAGQGGGGQ